MPVEFLSDEEAAVFGYYSGPPSRAELDRMFYLDDADLKLVAKRCGDHIRLGFSLQLATVRYLGTFLADPLDVPPLVVEHLAGQLGIADPSCVKRYPERPHTPLEHRDEIKAAGGLREFAEAEDDMEAHAQQNRPISPHPGRRYLAVMLNVGLPLDDPSGPRRAGRACRARAGLVIDLLRMFTYG